VRGNDRRGLRRGRGKAGGVPAGPFLDANVGARLRSVTARTTC